MLLLVEPYDGMFSSDDEEIHNNQMMASESEDEGIYPFRRNRNCDYFKVSHSEFLSSENRNVDQCNFSHMLKVSAIGHGNHLEKMELRIRNIDIILHPCVFQGTMNFET